MTQHIKELFLRISEKKEGWNKITDTDTNYRYICVGNQKNCNDELLRNSSTYDTIKQILDEYNISEKSINVIDNNDEYSVELILEEAEYNKLINKLKND
jgi:hypothetical protein